MKCKRCGVEIKVPSFCDKCDKAYLTEQSQLSSFYFVEPQMIDGVNLLLRGLKKVYPKLNHESPHLFQTPTRVARMFIELCSGLGVDEREHLNTSFTESEYDGIVFIGDIQFQSLCVHHLAIFRGIAHVAYIPDGKVVGLSKINRVVETLASRPQIQEQLTYQIAHTIQETLKPKGVACVVQAHHDCIEVRGVKSRGSMTKTSEMLGCFFKNDYGCKDEFMKLIQNS
jgi:GTP cyclohydrolase IA